MMSLSTFLLALYTLTYCVMVGSVRIQQTFTIAMTDMVVNSEWMYEDCYHGTLSDIDFHIEYAYGKRTVCKHNANLVIPVEYTGGVEALIDYGERASDVYSPCIMDQSCLQLNMTEWKLLALEQFRACEHCEKEDGGDDCINWITETNQTAVKRIIQSMFVVAKFSCSVETANRSVIAVPVVKGSGGQSSIRLSSEGFRCSSTAVPYIEHITEQANDTRMRVKRNNSILVDKIRNSLADAGYGEVRIDDNDWSIQGNYYWGGNKTRANPHSLLIYYNCTNLPATGQTHHRAKRMIRTADVYSTEETPLHSTLVIAASVLAVCIFGATLATLGVVIRDTNSNKGQPLPT